MSARHQQLRARSARLRLTALVLGLVLPALLYSAYLIANVATAERARQRDAAIDLAARAAAGIDRELAAKIAALRVLAASGLDLRENLDAARNLAMVTRDITGSHIVVKDSEGQQYVNTRAPRDQPLPTRLTDTDRKALALGVPVVSDIYTAALTRIELVSVNIPVTFASQRTGVVNMAIEPAQVIELLRSQALPEGWVATVVDSNSRIVARTNSLSIFGTQISEQIRQKLGGEDLAWSLVDEDGVRTLDASARLSLAPGWRTIVTVPLETIEGPMRRTLAALVLIGVVTLGTAVFAAGRYVEHIAGGLTRLVDTANAIGSGRPVAVAHSAISEINAVTGALTTASAELGQRAEKLRENEQRLRLALEAGSMGAWDWDLETGDVHIDKVGADLWGVSIEPMPRSVDIFFPSVEAADIDLLKNTLSGVIEDRRPYTHEFRVRSGSSVRWLAARGLVISDATGTPVRMIGVNFDITDAKNADAKNKQLVAELNHRVKNSLAVIQAIANETVRESDTLDDFAKVFSGRLKALATSHALLSKNGWLGADLEQIVTSQMRPFCKSSNERFQCTGPKVKLGPDLSLALTSVLHELATNSAKHGALATEQGKLSVAWIVSQAERGRDTLNLDWVERGGPAAAKQPLESSYGTKLIDQSLAYTFKGEVKRQLEPAGLTVRINVPIG